MKQFKVLQRISDDIRLSKSNQLTFKFEIENTKSVDSIKLETSFEMIILYIVKINISFLLSLVDLNRLNFYFNNLINELMQDRSIIIIFQINMKNNHHSKNDCYSVIRRYKHVFLL